MWFDVATLLDKTITRLAKYKKTRKADGVIAIFGVDSLWLGKIAI